MAEQGIREKLDVVFKPDEVRGLGMLSAQISIVDRISKKLIERAVEGNIRFLAVAEHRSISRAAEALHISQPALSRTISLLEARYIQTGS